MKNSIFILAAAMLLQSFVIPTISSSERITNNAVLNAAFGDIHIHKQGKGVKVQWTMENGSGVSNYAVQVTYEDPLDEYSNWTTKGNVAGGKKVLMFTDNTEVYQGDAYYRIVATTQSGEVTSNYQWINIQ